MPSKAPKKIVNLRFLIVIIFFALFAGNAFAQACVDMPALLGYIGDWKTGSMDMPTLLGYIGDWKAGTGCGTTTMTTASRTSGVMPLGVFFDAVDNVCLVVASSVVQPKGLAAQPVQITGVKITTVSFSNALGNGTLSFNAAAKTLSWNSGTTTNVSAGGNFVLPSSSGAKLYVWVDPAQLPSSNVSEQITIENGGVNADWAAFNYEWDFGDPAPSGTSSTDPLWFWEQGAKKSDGSWFEKNKAFGWNAAHVYENEGTYQVKLKIIDDEGGTHEYAETITVAEQPAGGWTTYYFAASGLDTKPCSLAEPCQTWEKAKTLAGSNVKLLFNRGDSFAAAATWSPNVNGALYVGAYGTGDRPRFTFGAGIGFLSGNSLTDARFVDLWIDGDYPATVPGRAFAGMGNNGLALRCQVQDMEEAWHLSSRRGSVVQDCQAQNSKKYNFWISENPQTAILGSTASLGNEEALLRTYNQKLVVSHNEFSKPSGKYNIGFRSVAQAVNWYIISHNLFDGSGIYVGPDNSPAPRHVWISSNQGIFSPDSSILPGSFLALIRVDSSFGVTIVNNTYVSTVKIGGAGVSVGLYDLGGPVSHDNLRIMNNNFFYSSASGNLNEFPVRFLEY